MDSLRSTVVVTLHLHYCSMRCLYCSMLYNTNIAHVHACKCGCVRACVPACMRACMHACVHVHVHVCMCMCMCVHMCLHLCGCEWMDVFVSMDVV